MSTGSGFETLVAERTRQFTGREWVFTEIDAWLAESDERLFFLSGGPGSGKTAISARLVQIMSGQVPAPEARHLVDQPLAFYYFCQAGSEELDPLYFVSCLALALTKQFDFYANALAQLGNQQNIIVKQTAGSIAAGGQVTGVAIESLTITDLSARLAFNRTIREPLLELYQKGFDSQIIILIDALDEALTYHKKENLVSLLAHLLDKPQELPPTMRFIVTGRPDERLLHQLPSPSLDLLYDAPDDLVDVRRYARRRLAGLAQEQKEALAERIAITGKGNFLYARYTLDHLLARITPDTDVSILPLTETLKDIYQEFLSRELAGTPAAWREKYGLLVSILAVARGEGLTRDQLAGMVNLDDYEADTILTPIRQYLTFEAAEGPFRIYHQSFREFLLGLDEGIIRVYPAQAHRTIASFFLEEWADAWDECDEPYPLLHLSLHMQQARRGSKRRRLRQEWFERLRALLLDFGWLRARLEATDVATLITDFDLLMDLGVPSVVQGAIQKSARVLTGDKSQLAGQLRGRLLQVAYPEVRSLLRQAQHSAHGSNLSPMTGSLTFPLQLGLRGIAGHEDEVSSIVATRDGKYAISACRAGRIKIWDLENGALLRTIEDDANGVADLAVTADGRHAVSASNTGLRVWDLEQGTLVRTIGESDARRRAARGAAATAGAVRVTPDSRLVLSTTGATLQVWNFETGALLYTLEGHARNITSLVLTSDGSKAITGCRDWTAHVSERNNLEGERAMANAIRVWDLANGRLLHRLPGPVCGTNAVAVSADDSLALSVPNSGLYVFSDGRIRVWNIESGELIRTMGEGGHTFTITSVAITPDNRLVLSGGGNCFQRYNPEFTLKLWDFETGRLEHTFDVHTGPVVAIQVTADGRWAVSAGGRCDRPSGPEDFSIRVWDLDRRELVATFQGEDSITCLSIPNEDTIVAGSRNGAVHILRLRV